MRSVRGEKNRQARKIKLASPWSSYKLPCVPASSKATSLCPTHPTMDSSSEPRKDFYRVLGLSPSATLDDIKKRYRELAFVRHPDRNYGIKTATADFQLVSSYTWDASQPVLIEEATRGI